MANWLDTTFHTIDYNVSKFFNMLEINGGKPMTYFWEFISHLGTAGLFMIAVSLVLCFFPKTRRMGTTALLAIAIGAVITSLILKPLIARARPYIDTNSDYYIWWLKAGKNSESDFSFPSGHTTASMALALSIFITSKKKRFIFPILIFPILMASSRIYLMVHYFSDCLFGLLVGGIASIIAFVLTHLLFYKTNGKFNDFINNYNFKSLFKNNKKQKAISFDDTTSTPINEDQKNTPEKESKKRKK